jgi:hypothetical protein
VKLLGYDYDIEYKQGRENVSVDALSRIPNKEVYALTTSTISTGLLAKIKKSDEGNAAVQEIIKYLQESTNSHSYYTWVNDHLNRRGKVVVGKDPELRDKLIYMFYNSAVGGHSGMTVTTKTIGGLFYWKGQQKHIRQFIRECNVCQRNKHENIASPGLLQPLPIPSAPFIDINMDFVEGLPKSEGKDVILVVVDRFSKYAHCMALSHPYFVSGVAKIFLSNVYKLHGLPASITNDRDLVFLSRFWKELFTSQTEIVNKYIEQYLRCMTGECLNQWVK